jgi:hypothetical protein
MMVVARFGMIAILRVKRRARNNLGVNGLVLGGMVTANIVSARCENEFRVG